MKISSAEMKQRAELFVKEYEHETSEKSQAQNYWRDFFQIFGFNAKTVGMFEKKVETLDGNKGYIDLFWSGNLIVEHKTYGKNLNKALKQAIKYAESLKESERPKYIIVCDFKRIILHDLVNSKKNEIQLSDLPHNLTLFKPIFEPEFDPETDIELNLKASELMADLHDSLKETNYTGHNLEVFIIRILFCLYAEDTGIFNNHQFTNFVKRNGEDNPQKLGEDIQLLFRIMNQKEEERQIILTDEQNSFPYVNGKLFEEQIIPPAFNQSIYNKLVKACHFDWSSISPSIFGSLVQYVIKPEERRNLGAHYTSEENIKKVIDSLFLDELWKLFNESKHSNVKLKRLHEKIGSLKFLDPACGCGNFLIVTYKELRLLEYEILKILKNENDGTRQTHFSFDKLTKIRIDNFYGIEIEEFPSRVAQVAMWFIEHQMNLMYETLDIHQDNLPLKSSLNIYHGNALRMDWKEIIEPTNNLYILGNPPFAGKQEQNQQQKNEMKNIFKGYKNIGKLDYVTAWYKKAAEYIQNTDIECAFVSTNSICQGEQVEILWKKLKKETNIVFNFVHQTFKWSNEAKNNAGVYVIIIGFSIKERKIKKIFNYKKPNSTIPDEKIVKQINSYLVESDEIYIKSLRKPLSNVPEMTFGSMPNDGGNLLLTEEEKNNLILNEPESQLFIKKLISAKEYLNNENRFCLWLKDITPSQLSNCPIVKEKIQKVKEHRLNSSREATKKLARYPQIFGEDRQPNNDYILIPLTTSENREYIPISIMNKNIISNNTNGIVNTNDKYIFGILTSKMHMVWMKYVCGRLKGDYRYSISLVYNNFPFPKNISENNKNEIRMSVDKILRIRQKYADESLSNLYNPLLMPIDLKKSHEKLDKLVDKSYGNKKFKNENDRIEFLFKKYKEIH